MSITGYYDGTAVRVNEQLHINQKVIVIPIEGDEDFVETAAGSLHKYADLSLVEKEKGAWREAVMKKHVQE